MRALMILVVAMGVLIVAGVVGLVGVVASRVAARRPAEAVAVLLDEPAGTRIAGIAAVADGLALQLQGGGADRVVVVDPRLHVVGRLGLAR
jgi:hypothetical protein